MTSDLDGNKLQVSKNKIKAVMREQNERVSDDAALRMAYQVEQMVRRRARAARLAASHDGRKTIQERDLIHVENVMDEMEGE